MNISQCVAWWHRKPAAQKVGLIRNLLGHPLYGRFQQEHDDKSLDLRVFLEFFDGVWLYRYTILFLAGFAFMCTPLFAKGSA